MLAVLVIFVVFSEDTRLYLYSQRVVPEEYFYAKDLPWSHTLSIIRRQQKSHVSVFPSLHL